MYCGEKYSTKEALSLRTDVIFFICKVFIKGKHQIMISTLEINTVLSIATTKRITLLRDPNLATDAFGTYQERQG